MNSFYQRYISWKNKKNGDPQGYEECLASHEENYTATHTERSGKMEIDAIVKMFTCSIEEHSEKNLT